MSAMYATGNIPTSLDIKIASKLLDLLATDNSFRRLFKKNPRAALVQAGHAPNGEVLDRLSVCFKVNKIASKNDIVKSRDALLEMMTSGMSQNPIHLNIRSENSAPARRTIKSPGKFSLRDAPNHHQF